MKKCVNCNKMYDDDALVCPYCGVPATLSQKENVHNNVIKPDNEKIQPKKNISLIKILLWIIFLPIMATIAIIKSKKMKKISKAILVIAIWLFCFIIIPTNSESDNSTAKTNASEQNSEKTNKKESKGKLLIKTIGNFDKTDYSQNIGDTKDFTLNISPKNIKLDDLCIVVANKEIVDINKDNIENKNDESILTFTTKALAAGKTTIKVQSKDGKIASNEIIINVEKKTKVEEFSKFASTNYTQKVGDTVKFTINIYPAGIKRQDIVLVNENDNVIKVSENSFRDNGDSIVFEFTTTALATGQDNLFIKSSDGKVVSDTITFTVSEKDNSRVVYVTPTGKKYHFSKSCAGKNASETTLNQAIKDGYEPCKKCAH